MKTQLVYLEMHDDLVSIRDKMEWAKTPRILLVWPRKGHVDVRPFDLAMLRRHARALGAELGLVAHDAELAAAARRLDLPVFPSAGEAQRRPWPQREILRPGRRSRRPNLRALRAALPGVELFDTAREPSGRLAVFTAGVLAVLAVVLVFIPSAEIHITPPTRSQNVNIAVSAEPGLSQVSLSGAIPSRELVFEVTGTDAILSSGQAVVPDQMAQGHVRLTNLTDGKLSVPAGTVLVAASDSTVRFATVEDAEVPPGNGENVDVPVRALAPGTKGNVPAGTLVAFEGPLGLSLSVTNPEATGGGSDQTVASPTDADRQVLRDRLLAKLKDDAKSQVAAQLRDGDVFFPSTFVFSKVTAETYTTSKTGGKLTLEMHAEFRAHYAARTDLEQLAGKVLDASLPAGYEAVDGTLTVQPASSLFGNTDGLTRWHVQAGRSIRARIDPVQVMFLVRGRTTWGAGSLLQATYGLETAPQISVQPFFWPWLPALPFRIKVAG